MKRDMLTSSRVVAATSALFRSVKVAQPARPTAPLDRSAELVRQKAVADSSRFIVAVEHAINAPMMAWRHSLVAAVLEPRFKQLRGLELHQRVRLIGWMLIVVDLTAGFVGGLRNSALPSLVIGCWATLLAFGVLLMLGSRQVAAAWRRNPLPLSPPAHNEALTLGIRRSPFAVATLLAAIVGVVYVLSPLTVFFILAAWLLLGRVAEGLERRERRWVTTMLLAAIVVRLLLVIGLFLYGDLAHRGMPDFFRDGEYMKQRSLWLRNVWFGLPIGSEYFNALSGDYAWTGYYYLLACVQAVVGEAPYGVHLINIGLFLLGACALHSVMRAAYGRVPAAVGLAIVLFMPSFVLWSASALKESFLFFLVVTIFAGTIALERQRTWVVRGSAAALVVVAAAVLWTVRIGAVGIMIGGVAGSIGGRVFALPRRLALPLVAVALVATYLAAGYMLTRTRVPVLAMQTVTQSAIVHIGHVATIGHSYRLLDDEFYRQLGDGRAIVIRTGLTPAAAARFVLRGFAAFAIVPRPWDAVSGIEVAYLPQQMLWYVLLMLAVPGLVSGFRRDAVVTGFLAGSIAAGALIITINNGNVGTFLRLRDMVAPFVALLGAVGAAPLLGYTKRLVAARPPHT